MLQGTPTQAGTYDDTFRVKVQDALGYTDTEYISIFISNSSLYIEQNSLDDGCRNVYYSDTLSTTGGSSPYNWSISSGSIPPGLSFGPSTSSSIKLNGTPTTAGTYGFTVRAAEGGGAIAAKNYSVDIGASCLDIDSISFQDGYVSSPYPSTQMDASGGNTPYAWSISSGSLPAGLSLSSGGLVSGTPTGPAGTSSFGIRVTDEDNQTALGSYSITIYPSSLIITTSSLPNGNLGAPYSSTLAASGGATPYTWSQQSGSLPNGLVLYTNGQISGTPAATGGFTFTVRVTDNVGSTYDKSFTVTINSAALSITTSSLPNAINGTYYSQTISASGGTAPYAWSVLSGPLPTVLGLNQSTGVLSGTPTVEQDFTFTIQVTDAAANTANRQYTVSVSH